LWSFYLCRGGGRLLDFLKPKSKEQRYNEDLADFVNDEYQRRQTERQPFELQWRLNQEFLNGNQYLDINPINNSIQEISKQYWHQEREVFNQISTIVETRIARLSRQKPLMKVRPASGDESDVSSAKVTSMLMDHSWNEQEMDPKYNDFVSWLEICGTVFHKPVWNVNKGKIMISQEIPKQEGADNTDHKDPETKEKDYDQETMKMFGADQQILEIREGDIETVVVPSHEMFPDSSYRRTMDDVRSMIHAKAFHVDDIEDMWGIKVNPEDVDVITLQKTSNSTGGLGYTVGRFRTGITNVKDHAVLKEYYERPSKKYPKGRFIVVAGDKTLHAGPLPYTIGKDDHPDLPFIRTVSVHVPDCFWGKSVIERCIPIQRRYNALRNRKAEYLNLVTIGQWYEEEGSIDEDVELNNAPQNIIRYNKGHNPPKPVEFPNLPSSFENEEKTLMQEFSSVSGVSELSRFSEAPSGVKSGVALNIANEQDDTKIAITASRIANSTVKLGKMWIRLYRQFVQEPRVLRTVGVSKEVEVKDWTVSNLTSEDIFIENGSALAETPAQKRQMVFDLMNTGIFNRPETNPFAPESIQKILRLIEFGHWETGLEETHQLQRNRAKRESRNMMEGQQAPVMDFDDHEIHIEMHNRQRMQAEYEEILRTPIGPMVDQIMRQHIGQHYQMMVEQFQNQMKEQLGEEQQQGNQNQQQVQ
jgi:hypothetical protein